MAQRRPAAGPQRGRAPQAARSPRTSTSTTLRRVVRHPGIRTLPACPAHARHRRVQRLHRPDHRRLGGDADRERSSTPSSCSTPSNAQQVNNTAIVGDAFARPILAALDAEPDRWDISSLRVILSSGVMWSQATKDGLLRHNPRMLLVDSLGSSEAIGMASSVSGGDADSARDGHVHARAVKTQVITDDGRRSSSPGDDEIGKVAIRGHVPIGYYKDPVEVGRDVRPGRRRTATRCRATTPGSRPTARSSSSAAGRCASTPVARRSSPRRSRRRSRSTPSSTTPWSSACPTSASARPSPPSSSPSPARRPTRPT